MERVSVGVCGMVIIREESPVSCTGRIRISVYDLKKLYKKYPEWNSLSKKEKLEIDKGEPEEIIVESNTTTQNLHKDIVRNFDRNTSSKQEATHLAVGVGTSTPSATDTILNNEVYRTLITSVNRNGRDLETSTFLDGGEANGYTLSEVGLTSGDYDEKWKLYNRSLLSATLEKTSTKTATIEVILEFRAI